MMLSFACECCLLVFFRVPITFAVSVPLSSRFYNFAMIWTQVTRVGDCGDSSTIALQHVDHHGGLGHLRLVTVGGHPSLNHLR